MGREPRARLVRRCGRPGPDRPQLSGTAPPEPIAPKAPPGAVNARISARVVVTSASHSTRKRTLRRAHSGGYRQVAGACFTHALSAGDGSLVLYDVTTLYFEAEKEDLFRKVGYRKERRVDPQIVVGLLVDRAGSPSRSAASKGIRPRR